MGRVLILAVIALTWGCAVPRIILLNDPLGAEEHNNLGVAYETRNEADLARREYQAAAGMASAWATPVINLGNLHAAAGEWERAAHYYRQAVDREAGNGDAMNNLAWALLRQGEHAEAFRWAVMAVARDPRHPGYLDTLAEIHMARGELDSAREALQEALRLEAAPEMQAILRGKRALLGP